MKFQLGIWFLLTAFLHAAGLEFKETVKELHAPPDVKKVSSDFEFTNRSNKPVTVAKYESTCSCMAVTIKGGKLRYAPGESGVIRAEFDMGNFSGEVDKVVVLWLDDAPADKPSLNLTVRVHIPVLVSVEPKTVKWDVNGKGGAQTIHLKMNHDKPIRVTGVTCSSESFKQELKTVEEGKSYDLTITPLDVKSPGLAVIRIETDCAIEKYRIQQAFAVVRKPTPGESAANP
jgi:Protein of unknown function (DUF1573)